MSFLTALSKVGSVLHVGVSVAQSVAPLISLVPGGAVVLTVLNTVVAAESVITQAGSGGAKKETVMAMLRASLPGVDQSRLSQAVDLIVAALNILTNVKPQPVAASPGNVLVMDSQLQGAGGISIGIQAPVSA